MSDEINERAIVKKSEMEVSEILSQVAKIQEIMAKIMHENEHYGIIPGCQKPSLLKPGAEKLGLAFKLKPEFIVQRETFENGHVGYDVQCTLIHVPSGASEGQGVGYCSTMESKYRYRWENTKKLVPKEYWDTRDSSLLGGNSFVARKVTEDNGTKKWYIFQRVEHDNPADYYNTVLKMAKKRAHVDAMLTATAASDIFTQDVEDLPEHTKSPLPTDVPFEQQLAEMAEELEAEPVSGDATAKPPEKKKSGTTISESQAKMLYAKCKAKGLTNADIHKMIKPYGYEKTFDIDKSDLDRILAELE